jgi:diaminopimelate epimerase
VKLSFEKWHGAKNDFILTWITDDQLIVDSLIRQAPALCQRDGSGIGADGLLLLTQNPDRSILLPDKLTIINSDGSLAATCGNGIRCAALSVLKRHYDAAHRVEVPEGLSLNLSQGHQVNCRFLSREVLSQESQVWPYVSVDMGIPQLNEANAHYADVQTEVAQKAHELNFKNLTQDWSLVNIGNEHLVFFVDEASQEMLRTIGPAMQASKLWDGINVHLASPLAVDDAARRISSQYLGEPIEELYEVWVWERGAGATQACGSGACAVAKAVLNSGLVERNRWIGIQMPGGRLYVKQEEDDDPINLAGPGQLVFTGDISV